MNDPLVYDIEWHRIPEQDRPEPGMVFVCKDSQKRTSPECWVVAVMVDGLTQKGLFWHKEDAIMFAQIKAKSKGE